ncbi:TPA: hypothetical protein ACF3DL_002699, partial [Enterococcus faecium]
TININGRYIIINKIKFKVSVIVELTINVGTPEKKESKKNNKIFCLLIIILFLFKNINIII